MRKPEEILQCMPGRLEDVENVLRDEFKVVYDQLEVERVGREMLKAEVDGIGFLRERINILVRRMDDLDDRLVDLTNAVEKKRKRWWWG